MNMKKMILTVNWAYNLAEKESCQKEPKDIFYLRFDEIRSVEAR